MMSKLHVAFDALQVEYIEDMIKRVEKLEHAVGVMLREKLIRYDSDVSFSDEILQSFVDKAKEGTRDGQRV